MASPPSAPPPADPDPDDPSALGPDAIFFASLLICALLGSHIIIRTRCAILPESSVAIVVGAAFGGVLRVATLSDKQPFWEFDPNLFFYVLLPPIIFEAGYSLKRRLFLTNIGAIIMFAVVGTAVSAGVVAGTLQIGGLLGWLDANLFGGVNTASGIHGSLLFASLISATDAVATLAILSSPEVNADPDLQATLFGESVLNDAVAIVLFQTLYDSPFSEARGGPGDASAILDVLGAFVKVSIGATAIGFALGLLLSLLLRHGTLYERSTHIEVSLTMGCAYLSYAVAEWLQLSGVLALFFCGVTLGHYNWYNLSDAARLTTAHTTRTLSYLAETVVFAYLGLSACDPRAWAGCDWGFIGLTLLGCILGRILNVFPLAFLINRCRSKQHRMPFNAQCLMSFAGLRGAIAFALALSFPGESRYVVVSATIVTVLISSLLLGGLTAPLVRMLKISDNSSGSGGTAAGQQQQGGSGCLDDNDTNCHGLSTSASSLSSPTPIASPLSSRHPSSREQPSASTATDSRQQPLLEGATSSSSSSRPQQQAPVPPSAARQHPPPRRPPRSKMHSAWRRFDRKYLQYWFGGPATASARKKEGANELLARKSSTRVGSQVRAHSSRLRRGGGGGGSCGGGDGGGSGVAGGGGGSASSAGGGFWGASWASYGGGSQRAGVGGGSNLAPAEEEHEEVGVEEEEEEEPDDGWLAGYDEDGEEEEEEVEAERIAAEEMLLLVRKASNEHFYVRPRGQQVTRRV